MNKLFFVIIFTISIPVLLGYQEAYAESADLTWTGPMIIFEDSGNPEPFVFGDFIKVRGTILNQGTDPAISFGYQLRVIDPDGNLVLTQSPATIPVLQPGDTTERGAFFVIPASFGPGEYTLVLRVDQNNVVAESDETNNDLVDTIMIRSQNGQVIGGEIIPINTTSLLLAGVQTNLAWIIPISLSAVGVGVYLAKTKWKK